jgi:hypothetical protein
MCLVDGRWQLRARFHEKRHIDHPIYESRRISIKCRTTKKVYCTVKSTHRMSKYLALLAMPPPLRKLSASMSDQSTCDGYRRGILTIADRYYL